MVIANILVVDDEEDLADNLADFLELEGFSPLICTTAEDAVDLLNESLPDMALLDIQLPGMSGIELLSIIKDKYPSIPVVMISASSQKDTQELLTKYHADGMLLKPYDQDELLHLIKEKLNQV